jgi:hypothetical protein
LTKNNYSPVRQSLFFFFLRVLFILFSSATTSAQTKDSASLKITGYADAYYAYYTDSVGPGKFQKFPSVSPRSNQFGLNTAQVTVQYDGEKTRGLITLHYGDIPVSAWSSTFNSIMEAHAGVRLCKTLWLDAGFFRTHVGLEGLLPKENFASAISVSSFYEPYFESGVRLCYNPNNQLAVTLLALNGYNIYEDNNNKKSLGALIMYVLDDKGSIGYSNYTGDDSPPGEPVSHLRIHNSIFMNYQFGKLKMQAGFDYCEQQHADTTGENSAAYTSGVFSLKYLCGKSVSVYAREEFFNDPQGCMSGVFTDKNGKLTGYVLTGTTAGVEHKPTDNSYIRMEGRLLVMDKSQEIFYWDGYARNFRFEFMMNMGITFGN